jgi:hypothetical protein
MENYKGLLCASPTQKYSRLGPQKLAIFGDQCGIIIGHRAGDLVIRQGSLEV